MKQLLMKRRGAAPWVADRDREYIQGFGMWEYCFAYPETGYESLRWIEKALEPER